MEDKEYSLFLAIAGMAIFAYALSAVGRRWQRGFSEKPLAWLSALERKNQAGRLILTSVMFATIVGLHLLTRQKRHPDPRLVFLVVGISCGIGNMCWELN